MRICVALVKLAEEKSEPSKEGPFLDVTGKTKE
jgi:hypothetical protein